MRHRYRVSIDQWPHEVTVYCEEADMLEHVKRRLRNIDGTDHDTIEQVEIEDFYSITEASRA